MSVQVRFGWIHRVHASIQDGATNLLGNRSSGDASLYDFLDRYNDQFIHYYSDQQDVDPETPDAIKGHSLDTEKIWDPHAQSSLSPVPQPQGLFTVQQRFHPEKRPERVSYFRENPLDFQTVANLSERNVAVSVVENYNQLVQQLREAPQKLAQGEGKRDLVKELCRTLGKLSHYVGDLHDPMHNTMAEWRLPEASAFGTAHYTIDGVNLMDEEACLAWKKAFNKTAPAWFQPSVWGPEQIKRQIARAAEQGHLKVFDIFKTDMQARQSSPNGDTYTKNVTQAWRPIVQEQMASASRMLVNILHSAYAAAGRPNLDRLI